MKLLFVANTEPDPNQGASGCDLATIKALQDVGCEVDTVWSGDMPRRIKHGNLHQCFELPRSYARVVAQRCRNQHYDVIQVNQPHAYRAAREHKRMGRPGVFVNRSHGWEPHVRVALKDHAPLKRGLVSRITSDLMWSLIKKHNDWVLQHSDGVVLCSIDDRDFILRHTQTRTEKLLALAPGVPSDFLESPPMMTNRFNKLLYVGQFAPHKAPETVAQIANRVLSRLTETTFTWVCAKRNHQAALELLDPIVRNRVTLLDWMSRNELRSVYDAHGLLIFPSRFEGFSLTFLEAMARGLCVFASNIDGMRQTIRHGVDGFLFPVGDAGAFAETIIHLCGNPREAHEIGVNARAAAETFTWSRTALELLKFYDRLRA